MDAEEKVEVVPGQDVCPECGAEEEGYFCRTCGALLRGEEMVLCPRCHQIVPEGDYCNRCGQSLGGIALQLRQLAMAGDAFWVTSESVEPDGGPEPTTFQPDQSIDLEDAELPDWLQEIPTETAPAEVETRIYPALQPIQDREPSGTSNRFLILVILLMLVLMVGLMMLTLFVLLGGRG